MEQGAHTQALPPGSRLRDYTVSAQLGSGGFGITYKAVEAFTERLVAIKEYFPSGVAARAREGASVVPVSGAAEEMFDWGLVRFRQEARLLVGLRHPNIVPALSYFEANATAYLVMDFQPGRSLMNILAGEGRMEGGELLKLLAPLLDGVEEVHRGGILHRDIKPDNVLIRADGSPVLIDFGAARHALAQHSRGLTAVLSEGYGPPEQYLSDGHQGPWTDIYALGALMFHCLLGERPLAATSRVHRSAAATDPLRPGFARLRTITTPILVDAVESAMALDERRRPQSISELRALLWQSDERTLLLGHHVSRGSGAAAEDATARIAPQRMSSTRIKANYRGKYIELHKHLSNLDGKQWRATFGEIEEIIGFRLPKSARTHRPWWANSYSGAGLAQSAAWQAAGWKTTEVDLGSERVIFVRER